jgi:purine-binding chemotaxis protein CheW
MTGNILVAAIGDQQIALPAIEAQSVINFRNVTPVPHAPGRVAGLTALRSQVLTVIDCRNAVGLPPLGDKASSKRAIVVVNGGHHYALLVDQVADVTEMGGGLLPVPSHIDQAWASIAKGMVDSCAGLLLMIDVNALIFGANFRQHA